MRIGILSSSSVNLYGATLIAKLAREGHTPVAVFCSGESLLIQARKYVQRHGVFATIKRSLEIGGVVDAPNAPRQTLSTYALEQKLSRWDQSLPSLCRALRVGYFRAATVNAPELIEYVRAQKIDLMLNAGGELIRAGMLAACPRGVLNAHMAFLPTFRGFNVLEWSLFSGRPLGVTVHFIVRAVDMGDILQFREIPVREGDSIESLRSKSYPIAVELMTSAVKALDAGAVEAQRQAPSEGKQYFCIHPRLRAIAESRIAEMLRPRQE